MLVRDVMNKNVVVSEPGITVKEAARIMSQFHIGSLIILKNKKIVGIITERDILISVAQGKEAELTTVEEVMTKNVITIAPDKTVEDAVNLMIEHRIKKLPVVDGNKLVGIITASDIVVVEPKLIEGIANLISIKLTGYRGG
ncbi:MAG: CBS domain-containing protein [Candidatus Aenigmatarchaeota archaeon]